MNEQGRRLITGRSSHEIYVVDDNILRWVPDLWTMRESGLSPQDLEIVEDTELEHFEQGSPLLPAVPPPPLREGDVVESENAVWLVREGKLEQITDPASVLAGESLDVSRVVYLPASIIRSLIKPVTYDENGAK